MRLKVYADSGPAVGAGHVMRCQALAEAWEELGGVLTEDDPTHVVFDGYCYTTEDYRVLRPARILVIDDFAHAEGYPVDLVLNQNAGATPDFYRNSPAELLLGSSFVLLRRQFQRTKRTFGPLQNLLITLGGGQTAAHIDDLARALRHLTVYAARGDVSNMAGLMARCDIALSAAGSTAWELAFMGLPAILVVVAANQVPVAAAMAAQGAALNLGWLNEVTPARLLQAIESLTPVEVRQEMSQRGQSLVDGQGASRAAMRLAQRPLRLRPATPEDCALVYRWANAPDVRAVSFSSEPIAWETHVQWYRQHMSDVWLAVDANETPLGQIRFDRDGSRAVVSIVVSPDCRGRGIGSEMIRQGCSLVHSRFNITTIDAHIKPSNPASLAAFTHCGFLPRLQSADRTVLTWTSHFT